MSTLERKVELMTMFIAATSDGSTLLLDVAARLLNCTRTRESELGKSLELVT